jgi:hypothetical protein
MCHVVLFDVRMEDKGQSRHERPNMALGGITPKQRLAMAA